MILIAVILSIVSVLTFVESRIIYFGADFPVSNTILMFILININLLLLILLIFLVFRNLVKLLYDRKRKVMGASLRTRLVLAFVALTLLPTTVLFFFSINFITTSIEFWFNVPVEQALDKSLRVAQHIYRQSEESNRFFIERIAYQIKTKKLLTPAKSKALSHYVQIVQREFNFLAVETYSATAERIALAATDELKKRPLSMIATDNLQRISDARPVWTISERISDGELLRTICTVPFGVKHTEAEGFVTLTQLIPPELSRNMKSISRGFEEYQQILLLKKPIQVTYYITLSIVALLVVFCAVWFGFYLAKSITIPIMELAEGTRRVAEGDLSVTIGLVADNEIGTLVDSFNKMTRDLRNSREQIEHSAKLLREQNAEIEARRQHIEIVLKNVSAGVITLNARGFISTINTSAERMLNIKAEDILNKNYTRLLHGDHLKTAQDVLDNLSNSRTNAVELSLRASIAGRPRSFMVNASALKDDAGQNIGVVMVFDDLTDLEKAQRMAAWREVARRIAHEVKNPLTPIALSAQRLRRKYAEQINEPVFSECTKMIVDQVELIRNLVNEFAAFARFPSANPAPCELPPIIEETLALYRDSHPNIQFSLRSDTTIPTMNLDRQQIKQAMINLIENAIAAIHETGQIAIEITHDPILKMIRIEVTDDGTGISDEDKTRLFEPNFSTKKAGMGLGLTIVNTIVADHNGLVRVQDNQPHGAKLIIELPV